MYEYKVVPAPRRVKKIKGVSGAEELFAHTLTEAINDQARQGWEYVRAEHLACEAPRGWLRAPQHAEQDVLVFRRERVRLDPQVDSGIAPALPPEPDAPRYAVPPRGPAEPRAAAPVRREPVVGAFPADEPDDARRLGPAERY